MRFFRQLLPPNLPTTELADHCVNHPMLKRMLQRPIDQRKNLVGCGNGLGVDGNGIDPLFVMEFRVARELTLKHAAIRLRDLASFTLAVPNALSKHIGIGAKEQNANRHAEPIRQSFEGISLLMPEKRRVNDRGISGFQNSPGKFCKFLVCLPGSTLGIHSFADSSRLAFPLAFAEHALPLAIRTDSYRSQRLDQ